METIALTTTTREPWNKGKLVGQKTTEDSATRSIRNDRAHARRASGLDHLF
jgi:hypothetical protein